MKHNFISLKKAFDLFIFDRETYCSEKSVRNYQVNLSYFVKYMEEQFNLAADYINIIQVTPDHIRTYIIYLRHKTISKKGDKLLESRTIKTYMTDVRTFFHFLYDNEYLDRDVMRNIRIQKEEEKIKEPLYIHEVKEIEALFNENTKTGLRNLCIFHCMLDAGMRSGEVIRLKVSDVDFSHSMINIKKSKNAKGRLVPMAPNLKKLLHQYLVLYRPTCFCDSFFVNCGEEPDALTGDALQNIFYRIKKRIKIDKLNPHLCRHTFATAFMLQGGDLEVLRIYMGHTSYDTTRQYLHLATVYKNLAINDVYKLHTALFKGKGVLE